MIGEVDRRWSAPCSCCSRRSASCASPTCCRGCTPLTKASTVGVVLVAIGVAVRAADAPTTSRRRSPPRCLQLLTLPIGASLIARATYLAAGIPSRVDTVDELAERNRVRRGGGG